MLCWRAAKENERSAVMYNKIIWRKIFSYLSSEELAKCRLVCTFWNHVISQLDTHSVAAVYEEKDWVDYSIKTVDKYYQKPQKLVQLFLDQSANLAGCSILIVRNVLFKTLDYLASTWKPDESKRINAKDVSMKFNEFTQNVTSIKIQDCRFESEASLVLFIGSFPQLKCVTFIDDFWPWFSWLSGRNESSRNAILNGTYSFPHGKNSIWQLSKLRLQQSSINPELLFIFRYLLFQNCKLEELKLKLSSINNNYVTGGSLLSQLLATSMATLKKVVLDLNYSNSGTSMFPLIFVPNLGQGEATVDSPLEYLEIVCQDLEQNSNLASLIPWILPCKNLKEVRLSPLTLTENFPFEAFKVIMRKGCVIKLDVQVTYIPSDLMERIVSSAAMKKMLQTIKFQQYFTNDQEQEGLLKYFGTRNFDKTYSVSLVLSVGMGAAGGRNWGLPGDLLSKIFPCLTNLYVNGQSTQFWDADLQLVLQHLIHLRVLEISCNLSAVSDFGTTGRPLEGGPPTGISFSNLKQLRVAKFWNVGKHVTNKTLKHGFKGLKYLTKVYMFGESKITIIGKLRFLLKHNVEVLT